MKFTVPTSGVYQISVITDTGSDSTVMYLNSGYVFTHPLPFYTKYSNVVTNNKEDKIVSTWNMCKNEVFNKVTTNFVSITRIS